MSRQRFYRTGLGLPSVGDTKSLKFNTCRSVFLLKILFMYLFIFREREGNIEV